MSGFESWEVVSAFVSLCFLKPIIRGLLYEITRRRGNSRLSVFIFTAHIHPVESPAEEAVLQNVSELRADIVQPGVGGKTPCGRYPSGAIAPCLCTVIYCSL